MSLVGVGWAWLGSGLVELGWARLGLAWFGWMVGFGWACLCLVEFDLVWLGMIWFVGLLGNQCRLRIQSLFLHRSQNGSLGFDLGVSIYGPVQKIHVMALLM